jgi:hypothetical protein
VRRRGITRHGPEAAVRDGGRPADGVLRAGFRSGSAVVSVAGQLPADHHDEASVGVDDDLVFGGVPVVPRPRAATAWSQVGTRVPSTMSMASCSNRLRGWSAILGPS